MVAIEIFTTLNTALKHALAFSFCSRLLPESLSKTYYSNFLMEQKPQYDVCLSIIICKLTVSHLYNILKCLSVLYIYIFITKCKQLNSYSLEGNCKRAEGVNNAKHEANSWTRDKYPPTSSYQIM